MLDKRPSDNAVLSSTNRTVSSLVDQEDALDAQITHTSRERLSSLSVHRFTAFRTVTPLTFQILIVERDMRFFLKDPC
jgi:hypothetical protein